MKKSIILTPCTSTQRKLENEQRKSYRILMSNCWTTDIRSISDHSRHNRSRLWSRLHTALAQITRIALKWIYTVFKIFSPFTIFGLALKKQSCPENFHCIEYTVYIQIFWATCACPEKQSCPEFFTVLQYFLSFRIFKQLVLALKNRVTLKIFTVLNILFAFRSFEQLALALKNRVALELFTVLQYFYHSRFLSNLRLPWKAELPWIFHCIAIFFIIQDF